MSAACVFPSSSLKWNIYIVFNNVVVVVVICNSSSSGSSKDISLYSVLNSFSLMPYFFINNESIK
jgi:hypothetical protein